MQTIGRNLELCNWSPILNPLTKSTAFMTQISQPSWNFIKSLNDTIFYQNSDGPSNTFPIALGVCIILSISILIIACLSYAIAKWRLNFSFIWVINLLRNSRSNINNNFDHANRISVVFRNPNANEHESSNNIEVRLLDDNAPTYPDNSTIQHKYREGR